jgi:hypothetical protein
MRPPPPPSTAMILFLSYILEDSIVDPKSKHMHVVTRNVSFERAFLAEGQSRYEACSSGGHTRFSMDMVVTAWVGLLSHRCSLNARAAAAHLVWRVTDGVPRFESFLLPRMAGNSQQGQQAVADLCAQLAQRYPHLAAQR